MPRLSDSESDSDNVDIPSSNDAEVMQLFVSDEEAREFSGFSTVEDSETLRADSAKNTLKVNKNVDTAKASSSKGPGKGPGKNKKGKAPMKRKVILEDDTGPGPSSGKKKKVNDKSRPDNFDNLYNLLGEFMETYFDNSSNKSNAPIEPEVLTDEVPVDVNSFNIFGNSQENAQNEAVVAHENVQMHDEFKFELPKIFEDDVVYGESAQDNIAEMVNAITRKKTNLENVVKDIKIPSNCKTIVPPRINAEIWAFLRRNIKSIDLLMQNNQKLLGTAIVPVIKLAELLSTRNVNVTELRENVLKLMTMLCSLFFELSFSRKMILKPHLETKYHILCNRSEEIGQNLFGDDVSKRIKEINETQKLQGCMRRRYGNYSKNLNWPRSSGARGNMRGGSSQYQNQLGQSSFSRFRGSFRGRGQSQRGRYPRKF